MGGPVVVVDYDPQWPARFERLRSIWAAALDGAALRIEHVGSTSVIGLAAKPILDVDIVIERRPVLPRVVDRLASLGYRHQGDQGVEGRESFKLPDAARARMKATPNWAPHNLYVCAQDNLELRRHLAFRDWLRSHTKDAQAYATLKRELARRHADDRDAYCEAKTGFVESILARALA